MRRLALLLSLLALPVSAAVPTAQITGNQLLPDGSAPAGGSITCTLSQPGSVTDPVGGSTQRVASEVTFTLLNGGALPSTAVLVPNDAISPSGTTYVTTTRLKLLDGRIVTLPSERWTLSSSPSSISIGAITRVAAPSTAIFIAGPPGPTGPQGPQSCLDGAPGAVGPIGSAGPTGAAGAAGQSAVALNGTTATPLVSTTPAVNDPSASSVSVTTTMPVVGGITNGGTDRALSAWSGFAFAPTDTTTGGVSIRLKKDPGVADGGSVAAYIYTDASGHPGSDISTVNTGLASPTGLPTIVGTSELGTIYANIPFRIPKVGLTISTVYWIVLRTQGVTGGSVYIDSAAAAGNFAASASDSGGAPGTWTTSAVSGSLLVLGSSGRGVYSYSPDGHSIEAYSDTGVTLYGRVQYGGIAVKGDAIGSGIGIGGTSYNGTGGRTSSTNGLALQSISLNNYGAQIQGTGGAQLVATSAAATAAQLINSGGGNLLQGYDAGNGYAIVAQIGPHGDMYGSTLQLGTVNAVPAAPSVGKVDFAFAPISGLPPWSGAISSVTQLPVMQPFAFTGLGRPMWGCLLPSAYGVSAVVLYGSGSNSSAGSVFTGTAGAVSWASTDITTRSANISVDSAASAGSTGGARSGTRFFWRGNGSGSGGFYWWGTVKLGANVSRAFAGLKNDTAVLGNVDPSTLLDSAYIGADAGQTTLRFCTNDNTAAASCTDLGANFPLTSGATYGVYLYAPPSGTAVYAAVERMDGTRQTWSGSSSTQLPRTTASPGGWEIAVNTGAGSTAARMYFYGSCWISNP
jgi:hypothetical protein